MPKNTIRKKKPLLKAIWSFYDWAYAQNRKTYAQKYDHLAQKCKKRCFWTGNWSFYNIAYAHLCPAKRSFARLGKALGRQVAKCHGWCEHQKVGFTQDSKAIKSRSSFENWQDFRAWWPRPSCPKGQVFRWGSQWATSILTYERLVGEHKVTQFPGNAIIGSN